MLGQYSEEQDSCKGPSTATAFCRVLHSLKGPGKADLDLVPSSLNQNNSLNPERRNPKPLNQRKQRSEEPQRHGHQLPKRSELLLQSSLRGSKGSFARKTRPRLGSSEKLGFSTAFSGLRLAGFRAPVPEVTSAQNRWFSGCAVWVSAWGLEAGGPLSRHVFFLHFFATAAVVAPWQQQQEQ